MQEQKTISIQDIYNHFKNEDPKDVMIAKLMAENKELKRLGAEALEIQSKELDKIKEELNQLKEG